MNGDVFIAAARWRVEVMGKGNKKSSAVQLSDTMLQICNAQVHKQCSPPVQQLYQFGTPLHLKFATQPVPLTRPWLFAPIQFSISGVNLCWK